MKTLPRGSRHQELEDNPEQPFIDDIRADLEKINTSFSGREAKIIKKKMIDFILKDV